MIERLINLHISLLPRNRVGDSNFWSFLEGSPKGATIHQMSLGLDRGPTQLQKEAQFSEHETLRSTYDHLTDRIQVLFRENCAGTPTRQHTSRPEANHRQNPPGRGDHQYRHQKPANG